MISGHIILKTRGMSGGLGSISLPLSYRSTPGLPHHSLPHQVQARRQRRRLQLVEELSGDLINLGYYSAELQVGTPPQRFSVIVDTGSSVTAIPCSGCVRCGKHSNPRFEPSRSSTFRSVPCSEAEYCRSCRQQECGYRVSYQEGSSQSASCSK